MALKRKLQIILDSVAPEIHNLWLRPIDDLRWELNFFNGSIWRPLDISYFRIEDRDKLDYVFEFVDTLTPDHFGLGEVDNTSDLDKPISTATQNALDLKADDADLDSHVTDLNNPHQVTKADVGLANVDDTSDLDKPISTATQTALNHKLNTPSPGRKETGVDAGVFGELSIDGEFLYFCTQSGDSSTAVWVPLQSAEDIATALSEAISDHQHSVEDITDIGDIATINKSGETTQFLRGDGTWQSPPVTPEGAREDITELEADFPTGATGIWIVKDTGHWYFYAAENWIDGGLYQSPLAVVQTTGTSETDVMSQKAVTDEITQVRSDLSKNELLKKIEGVKISSGANLLNRNYIEPSNPKEYEKGGAGKLINGTTGIVVDYIGWYLSPLIEWNEQTEAIISTCRCWAQYGEDGVTLKDIYFPATAPSGNVLINKADNAVYFRVGIGSGNYMLNYGNVLLPYEPYKDIVTKRAYGETPLYFQADVDEIAMFKEMLLSESYIPQSPTYTDGTINSPINVIWADGDTGVLTLTRNTDGLVTKIVATKIRSGATTTLTENITRDTDGNVTLISIV